MLNHDILKNKDDILSLVRENAELVETYGEYYKTIVSELLKYDNVKKKDDLYDFYLYEIACYIQFREHVSPSILSRMVAIRHRQIEGTIDMKYGSEIINLNYTVLNDLYDKFHSLFSHEFDINMIVTCKLLSLRDIDLLEKSLMELSEDILSIWFEFMNVYHF